MEKAVYEKIVRTVYERRKSWQQLSLTLSEGVTARDIEEGAKLRQPEVSQGTNALINRKWIKMSKITTKGKGRPHYRYYLAKPKEKILNNIQEEIRKRIEQEQQNLITVRELLL